MAGSHCDQFPGHLTATRVSLKHMKTGYKMRIINFYKILIVLTSFLVDTCYAGHSNILIVNSDNSVYRYNEIATEFKNVLQKNSYKWDEFNLEKHTENTESELKQIIDKDNPDIIYCIGSKAYTLARNYAKDKKLLFSSIINWRRLNIGDNTYGIANELSPIQEISLLRYFFPTAKNIGLLYNDKFSNEYVAAIKKDATTLGLQVIAKQINTEQEISKSLNELLPAIDIFWVISDPTVLASEESVQRIFQSARQYKKPVYAYNDVFIKQGAVLSISADIATIGRQSASLVLQIDNNKIPNGTVQIPVGSDITLNKCTIDSLKINFNQDALDSVNNIVNCNKQ